MIRFTKFDPLSGRVISFASSSDAELVWDQLAIGQGFVDGWKDAGWRSFGDEGFVRDEDGFLRTQDWLDRHWPTPA